MSFSRNVRREVFSSCPPLSFPPSPTTLQILPVCLPSTPTILTLLSGMNSFLFQGNNTQNQTVYSWLPETNLTTIDADYSPLVHYLWQNSFMPKDLYLGTLQFGTESFHATNEVLFRAGNYTFNLSQNTSQVLSPLASVQPVAVPTQVPTMARFNTTTPKKSAASTQMVGVGITSRVWMGTIVVLGIASWL